MSMEYQLSITFAELGYSVELPDRLLAVLLESMPESAPVIGQDIMTGELTVVIAFDSARPTDDVGLLMGALDSALVRTGVEDEPTVLDVHVAAVRDDEEVAGAVALQPA